MLDASLPGRFVRRHAFPCVIAAVCTIGPALAAAAAAQPGYDAAPLLTLEARATSERAPSPVRRRPPGLRLTGIVPTGAARAVLETRAMTAAGRNGIQLGTETEITPEIYHLARGLRANASALYEFVRNAIDFTPSFGAKKGATMTFVDGCGNAFDQAALLVALFRAAGFNASFLFGTAQVDAATIAGMLGVPAELGIVSRALAAAAIPADFYVDGNGALEYVVIEHVWAGLTYNAILYHFDPSIKGYDTVPGIAVDAAMGYDRVAFLNGAAAGMTTGPGYVRDLNRTSIRADLDSCAAALIGHIRQHLPGAGLVEVIGGRKIVAVRDEPLHTQLSGHTPQEQWHDIPIAYLTLLRMQHYDIDLQVPAAHVYGKRLMLYYTAASEAVIGLDGSRLATYAPVVGGTVEPLTLTVDHPYASDGGTYQDDTENVYPQAGGVYFIANSWGPVSRRAIERRRYYLRKFLDLGVPNATEAVTGESLALIGLTWMAQASRAVWIGDRVSGVLTVQHHELGIVGQAEAPYMDMALAGASMAEPGDDATRLRARLYAWNGLKSGFEWAAIDQLLPASAVSTTKLIDQANADGLRVFAADSTNYATEVKPNLVFYGTATRQNIEAVIATGTTVYLPERGDLQDGAWRGAAYIEVPSGGLGMANQIDGYVKGGFYNELYYVEGTWIIDKQEIVTNDGEHSKSPEPIDLVTGYYLHGDQDLTVGRGPFPFELTYTRSYSSGQSLNAGRLGYGWSDNWEYKVGAGSDSFLGLGDAAPIDTAAAVVAMLVAIDMFSDDLQTDRVVIGATIHRWLLDQLIDNVTTVTTPTRTYPFVRLPDGSYNPPPGVWATLAATTRSGWRFTARKGAILDFDADGTLQQWRDTNANSVTLTYGADGPQTIASSLGRTLTLTYANGRVQTVSDAHGRSVTYEYDGDGDLVQATGPAADVTEYEYGDEHVLAAVYQPSSAAAAVVVNTYDTFRRVTEQTVAGELYTYYYARTRSEELGPCGDRRVYRFNRHGRTVATVDPLEHETTYEFDGQMRLVRMTMPDGNGREYAYDAHHNPASVMTFSTPASGETPVTEAFVYDLALNRVTDYTNARGDTVSHTYDAKGNLVRMQAAKPVGQEPVLEYTVTATGQAETRTGPEGVVTRYEYDAHGQPVTTVLDHGGRNLTTTIAYDPVGNMTVMTDPRGNARHFVYDAARRVVRSTAPLPFEFRTEYEYDSARQPVTVRRETGNIGVPWAETTFTYTPLGARSSVTDPAGRTTTFEYDACQRLQTVTDNDGHAITYEYDAAGRPWRQMDALDHVVEQHTYTPNGRHASILDGNGNATVYEHDGFDGLHRAVLADGSYMELEFDKAGNRVSERTRSGVVITYTYDALGRITTRAVPGVGTDTYTYDRVGRVTAVTGPAGTQQFLYDAVGNITSETGPDGRTVVSEYDAGGNRTRLVYSDGTAFRYVYDALNRLTEIRDAADALIVTYTYDARSRLVGRQNANATVSVYSYNEDDTVAAIAHQFDGSSVTYSYAYDAGGRLTDVDISNPEFAPAPPAALSVLLTANELNQAKSGAGAYQYDLNGNLVSDGVNQFTFDPRNRLIAAGTPAHQIQYDYDALDRRVAVTIDTQTVRRVYDAAHVVEEHDAGRGLVARYLHGPGWDNPVRLTTAAGHYFYHRNAIGSVVALTNAAGTVVERHSYSPFGLPTGTSATGNRRLFAGREYDRETGLYQYRARYYSPELAAFLSPDPSGTGGGSVNPYAYAYNNPGMYVDPTGEWVVAAVVAGAAVLILGSGYAVDHVEVSKDPLGGEAAAFGPWITVGPTFKQQHPVIQESMLVHERTHKWSFHGFKVWKTEYDKEYEAYKVQYDYLKDQRAKFVKKGDMATVQAIDDYIASAVIETYLNDPSVLEAIAPRKSVLNNIADLFKTDTSSYAAPPRPMSNPWPPSAARYNYQE